MAILRYGLAGMLSGKLGNVVVYHVLGKEVVRMKGRISKAPTEKQLANRQRLSVITKFLVKMKPFIEVGFGPAARAARVYPMNEVVKWNKSVALKGVYPDFQVDFEKVLLSKGDLPGLEGVSIVLEGNVLRFSWLVPGGLMWPRSWDQVMLLAFFPDVVADGSEFWQAYFVLSGARRKQGFDVLEIPAALVSERIEVYVAVVSDDRGEVSTSQYLGRLN